MSSNRVIDPQQIKALFGYRKYYLLMPYTKNMKSIREFKLAGTPIKEINVGSKFEETLKQEIKLKNTTDTPYYFILSLPRPDEISMYHHGSDVPITQQIIDYNDDGEPIYNQALFEKSSAQIQAEKKLETTSPIKASAKVYLGGAFKVDHAVCVVVDPKNKTITYKDSFGKEAEISLKKAFLNCLPGYTFDSNTLQQQHPEDHCHCYLFCLENIVRFSKDQALINPMSDDAAHYISVVNQMKRQYNFLVQESAKLFKEPSKAQNTSLSENKNENDDMSDDVCALYY